MNVNVGNKQRLASVLGGGALLTWAARKRSPLAIPIALGAAALVFRGVKGRWPVDPATLRKTFGNGRAEPQASPELPETSAIAEVDPAMAVNQRFRHGNDLVAEASEESFPASDPPSFTPVTST